MALVNDRALGWTIISRKISRICAALTKSTHGRPSIGCNYIYWFLYWASDILTTVNTLVCTIFNLYRRWRGHHHLFHTLTWWKGASWRVALCGGFLPPTTTSTSHELCGTWYCHVSFQFEALVASVWYLILEIRAWWGLVANIWSRQPHHLITPLFTGSSTSVICTGWHSLNGLAIEISYLISSHESTNMNTFPPR